MCSNHQLCTEHHLFNPYTALQATDAGWADYIAQKQIEDYLALRDKCNIERYSKTKIQVSKNRNNPHCMRIIKSLSTANFKQTQMCQLII